MYIKKTAEIGGKPLSIEVGKLAQLAKGSCVVTLGETMVLATVGVATPRPGIDFFPLTVEYREKTYAAGKIPGGFFKREARPTTKEVLGCRLIDRPIRPLFADGYLADIQIICYALSYDGVNDPDMLAGVGASMALMLAGTPFKGPVSWVRVGLNGDELTLFPDDQSMKDASLDLVVAGTTDSVTMVEAGAKRVDESIILNAIGMGHEAIATINQLQLDVLAEAGVEPAINSWEVPENPLDAILPAVRDAYAQQVRDSIVQPTKPGRQQALKPLKEACMEQFADLEETGEEGKFPAKLVGNAFKEVCNEVLRALIVDGTRVDGRKPDEIRKIECEVGVLPRAHGSALFQRGETQAIVAATLGTGLDEQVIDGIQDEYKKRFYLHYNFPPFCVGEVRPIRGTSRRELGHGNLAERSLEPMIPDQLEFPYTLRLVSEILMSNGSSSMASVCGGTLAMQDAGVKIEKPVAGIAMGLVKEGDTVVVLSDILGDEDHSGDMDFKVTGTDDGVTALQMDIKIDGVSREILESALGQAKEGRLHILGEMAKSMAASREDYSQYAPRLLTISIPTEKIGTIIGPGGKTIRQIQEETGSTLEVTDEGLVKIFSTSGGSAEKARQWVEDLTLEAEVGKIYEGPVVEMRDFGVFVKILPNQDGMVHVSELADGYVEKPEDVVKVGEVLKVKCIAVEQGKCKLSRRAVLIEEAGGTYEPSTPPSRGRGGGRDGNRGGGRGRGGDRDRGGDRGRGGDRRRGRGDGNRGGDRGGRRD
ncbi:MAG: polyribonucleotide nucleotidyltransferase [Planctomycetota bacterium]